MPFRQASPDGIGFGKRTANEQALSLPVRVPGIYRRTVSTARGGGEEVDPGTYVVLIAARLDERVSEVSAKIRTALADSIAELPGDARMLELLNESVEQNIAAILNALRHDIPMERITAPAAAIEYARAMAQRRVPANALVRAYRLGQRRMTELVGAELHAFDMDQATRVAVIEAITTVLLKYVDSVTPDVVAAYQGERKLVLENQHSAREMRVRDLLDDGRSVDVVAASTAIRYPLHRQHVALIVWYPGSETAVDELPRLQRFVRDLATAVDTSAGPLLATADPTTEWAWLPYHSVPGGIVNKIREFVRARPEAPNVAIGAMGSGVEGFRRSHRQAQRARAATLARSGQQRVVVAATDAGIIAPALLAASVEEVREWVADVLGPLASNTDDDARLRRTLRVFLHLGPGLKTAAEELNMHLHAVKCNVEQAVARRGRPIDDRLDVELALLVCQRYGAAVLQPA